MSSFLSEIRLFVDEKGKLCLECPQNFLIRLFRHLNSRGFKYDTPRITARDKKNARSIVKFAIEGSSRAAVKDSIRVFLSNARIKFTENSDAAETIFHLVNKGAYH